MSPTDAALGPFDTEGSIERALADVRKVMGAEPTYRTTITREGLSVDHRNRRAVWADGEVTVEAATVNKEALSLDLQAVDFPTWSEIAERSSASVLEKVVVANDSTWGLPLVTITQLSRPISMDRQVGLDFRPLPELSFSTDEGYDAGLAELVDLAQADRISKFLVHDSTMHVGLAWHQRFGGTPDIPGVSLHRTSKGRSSYLLVGSGDPLPIAENLFSLGEVRRDIIRKGVAEVNAPQRGWKASVALEVGKLVYLIEGGRDANDQRVSALYDADGRRIA